MSLVVTPTALDGVVVVEPQVFGDPRGFFFEAWHAESYGAAGLPSRFVQDNVSRSARGVLRGLHLQQPYPQGKLVQVLDGEVLDVAVDVRVGSPTFGRWVGVTLSSDNQRQVYVSQGFAHGFCVLSDSALVNYKCTEFYHPEAEFTVRWDDPAIGIEWPAATPILSAKDAKAPRLSEIALDRLPRFLA
jgi:dTDP-4-dehydrorhamnose 3,5-epimerase